MEKRDWISRVGTVLVIFITVVGGYWFYRTKIKGGNLDIPGINIFQEDSAGSDEPIGEPVTEKELIAGEVEDKITEKFNKDRASVSVSVDEYDENHARGTVSFSDEPTGAWWLAAKEKGGWKLVTSGNGDVICHEIEGYGFPLEMVPTCYDTTSQSLIKR